MAEKKVRKSPVPDDTVESQYQTKTDDSQFPVIRGKVKPLHLYDTVY